MATLVRAGTYGLETLDVVGSEGRFVLKDACEDLPFYPRFDKELENHVNYGGMSHFGQTFKSRITRMGGTKYCSSSP